MAKEKNKIDERTLANKERFDHLKVSLLAVPGIIYLIAMISKLGDVQSFMQTEGWQFFAEPDKNLLDVLLQLDFMHIFGGAYSLEQMQDLQFTYFVALFISLSSVAIYGARAIHRQSKRNNKGSSFVVSASIVKSTTTNDTMGTSGASNDDYETAVSKLLDELPEDNIKGQSFTTQAGEIVGSAPEGT